MKYVANCVFGGFELPKEYFDSHDGIKYNWDDSREIRTDPALIAIVESPDYSGDLCVLNIPDDATDIYVFEYDGAETVVYVLNGIIHEAEED